MEFLCAEVIELVGNAVHDNKTRVIPRHVQLALRNDEEFNKLNVLSSKVGFRRAAVAGQ